MVWGAIITTELVPPLCADVVYHLSILVDPNLNDSVALVNLFPGNSSVSVANANTGRREVFTVQQRNSIGRKIALSPNAAKRLGLGEGSIAEVRIVELALNGDTTGRDVNPAAEYQDIVASPIGTDGSFSRPTLEPVSSGSSVSSAAPNMETHSPAGNFSGPSLPGAQTSDLPSEPIAQNAVPEIYTEPLASGLPPANAAKPLGPSSNPDDESLVINMRDQDLHIPLPAKGRELKAQNPAPNPIGGSGGSSTPTEQPLKKVRPPDEPFTTQLPAGDPLAGRSRAVGNDGGADLTEAQLYSPVPKRNTPPSKSQKLNVVAPQANPNAAKVESISETEQPKLVQTNEPRATRRYAPENGIISPMGDVRPFNEATTNQAPSRGVSSAEGNSVLNRPADLGLHAGSLDKLPGENKKQALDEAVTSRAPSGERSSSDGNSVVNRPADLGLKVGSLDKLPGENKKKLLDEAMTSRAPSGERSSSDGNSVVNRPADLGLKVGSLDKLPGENKKQALDEAMTSRAPSGERSSSDGNSVVNRPADLGLKVGSLDKLPGENKKQALDEAMTSRAPSGERFSSEGNSVVNRSADLGLREGRSDELSSEGRKPPQVDSTADSPQIYFPQAADMNPPPASGREFLEPPTSVIATKPPVNPSKDSRLESLATPNATVTSPRDKRKIQPVEPNPLAPAHSRAPEPVGAKSAPVHVIGSLNNLGLPTGYYIQLVSFQDVRKTRPVYEQFVNEYKMNVVPTEVDGQKYYRCLIGNLNESEVASVLRKVRSAGYKDAFVYKN